MKIRKQKILSFICVFIMLFIILSLHKEKVYATAESDQTRNTNETEESIQPNSTQENKIMQIDTNSNNPYTVINSQTLLESNDLNNLKLNITTLPSVSVTGSAKYTIADSGKFTPANEKVRSVTFRNVSSRRSAGFSRYCQI